MALVGSLSLSFVIRWVHLLAMVVVVGGAACLALLFLDPSEEVYGVKDSPRCRAARRYERAFWIAASLLILTGVGNLGTLAGSLPTSETLWGRKLLLKLFGVLGLLLVSLFRTALVAQWHGMQDLRLPQHVRHTIGGTYAATALLAVAILTLGLSMAHG